MLKDIVNKYNIGIEEDWKLNLTQDDRSKLTRVIVSSYTELKEAIWDKCMKETKEVREVLADLLTQDGYEMQNMQDIDSEKYKTYQVELKKIFTQLEKQLRNSNVIEILFDDYSKKKTPLSRLHGRIRKTQRRRQKAIWQNWPVTYMDQIQVIKKYLDPSLLHKIKFENKEVKSLEEKYNIHTKEYIQDVTKILADTKKIKFWKNWHKKNWDFLKTTRRFCHKMVYKRAYRNPWSQQSFWYRFLVDTLKSHLDKEYLDKIIFDEELYEKLQKNRISEILQEVWNKFWDHIHIEEFKKICIEKLVDYREIVWTSEIYLKTWKYDEPLLIKDRKGSNISFSLNKTLQECVIDEIEKFIDIYDWIRDYDALKKYNDRFTGTLAYIAIKNKKSFISMLYVLLPDQIKYRAFLTHYSQSKQMTVWKTFNNQENTWRSDTTNSVWKFEKIVIDRNHPETLFVEKKENDAENQLFDKMHDHIKSLPQKDQDIVNGFLYWNNKYVPKRIIEKLKELSHIDKQ